MIDHQLIWDNRNSRTFLVIEKTRSNQTSSLSDVKIGIISPDYGFYDLTELIAIKNSKRFNETKRTLTYNPKKTNVKELIVKFLYFVKKQVDAYDNIGQIYIQQV